MLHSKIIYALFLLFSFPYLLSGQSENSLTRDSSILIAKLVVNYDSDSYEISDIDAEEIIGFIDNQNVETLFFDIKAYTDSDGSHDYNIKLSENRSHEVEKLLLAKGIANDQIVSHAYGESRAVDAYSDTEKALNRKTEITVFQKLQYVLFTGSISSEDTTYIEGAELSVYDEGVKRQVTIRENNKFSVPIPIDRKVELHFIAKDHFHYIERLKLGVNAKPRNINFEMKRMELGATLRMDLRFEGGLSALLYDSKWELESLFKTLLLNPDICIELAGHINEPNKPAVKRGSDNFDLSIARSLVIKEYLTVRDIAEDRLLSRGYGSSHMIYPKARSEFKMTKNRRVEVIVAPCDSTSVLLDDIIENPERFKISVVPIQRKYNPETIDEDLSGEKEQKVAADIRAQIAFLDSIQLDAKRYSYMQLLIHYRDRTRDK